MMKSEKAISNVSSVLGIVAFVGTIVTAFLGEQVAAYVLIGLTLLFWLIWLTAKVANLTTQMQKLSQDNPSTATRNDIHDYHIEKYLENAPLISSKDQKHEKINANFLGYEECTILIHVLVSNENTGIRNPKTQKYILGHREIANNNEINRFGLRYSNAKKWEVVFSNSRAETCYLSRSDGLKPGWHQFMIAWDLRKPQIDFWIDGGSNETSKSFLSSWPEHLADTASVGVWKSSDPGTFVETRLAHLWIIDRYLKPSDDPVASHKKLQKLI